MRELAPTSLLSPSGYQYLELILAIEYPPPSIKPIYSIAPMLYILPPSLSKINDIIMGNLFPSMDPLQVLLFLLYVLLN